MSLWVHCVTIFANILPEIYAASNQTIIFSQEMLITITRNSNIIVCEIPVGQSSYMNT